MFTIGFFSVSKTAYTPELSRKQTPPHTQSLAFGNVLKLAAAHSLTKKKL